jgi:sulfoxide reductase heme-binding subunit YedZ
MNKFVSYLKKNWLILLVNVAAVTPLALLARDMFAGSVIDPVAALTDRTGYTALVLLVLSLACTPVMVVTGYRKLVQARKWLGLHGFFYASLHLLTFVGLDYGFSLEYIFNDALLTKRYVVVGFAAFLLLVPVALTSTKGWMKRLGRNWKRLHRLVYLIVPLAVLHYVWVEKIPVEPLIFAGVVALLLLVRIPPVRRQLNAVRLKLDGPRRTKPSAKRPAAVQSEVARDTA